MRISDWSSDVCSSELVGACDLLQAGLAAGRGRVPWGHPTGRRGAGGVDGALFWRQLLSDAVAAERAADGAFQPGDRGAAHHAALSAQSDRKSVVVGKECVSTCRSWGAPYH